MKRFYDSFLIEPNDGLKSNGTAYKVFTPFYKNLMPLWDSHNIQEYTLSSNIKLSIFNYSSIPTLEEIGFKVQNLPEFLSKSAKVLLDEFITKLDNYQNARDYFYLKGTSNISVHLRFCLISPKQIFNKIRPHKNSEFL